MRGMSRRIDIVRPHLRLEHVPTVQVIFTISIPCDSSEYRQLAESDNYDIDEINARYATGTQTTGPTPVKREDIPTLRRDRASLDL